MGRISGSFSGAGITNDIIMVVYSTAAPAAEIARVVSPGPRGAYFNYVFTGLGDGTYIVRVYDSPDGTTLSNLRHEYWQDSKSNKILKYTHFFTVGGGGPYDPNPGTTVYANPDLAGREVVMIFQEGFRPLEPTVEVDITAADNVQLLGGIVFQEGQKWYMELAALDTVVEAGAGTAAETVEVLSASTKSFTSADMNKVWLITSPGNTNVTTLPQTTTLSDNAGITIVHDGGNLINLELRAFSGESIRFRGEDVAFFYMAKGERVRLVKLGTKWYVTDWQGQWDRVLHRIGVDVVPNNAVQANGTEYDGLVYKRLYQAVSQLPPAQLVSFATWTGSPDKQKFFAIDTSAKRIKVPDMQGMTVRFLKNIGSTDVDRVPNVAGMFQAEMVGPHTHSVVIPGKASGDGEVTFNDGSGAGKTYTTGDGGGTENIVANVGLIPVILI